VAHPPRDRRQRTRRWLPTREERTDLAGSNRQASWRGFPEVFLVGQAFESPSEPLEEGFERDQLDAAGTHVVRLLLHPHSLPDRGLTVSGMDDTDDVRLSERARELLTGMRIGYLSTARRDGHLGVVPVGVVRDGDMVKFSSQAATEKVRSLRSDPRVTLCVPDPADVTRYVEIRGIAEVDDDVDRAFVNWIAREFMGADEYPHESPSVKRVVVTIHPRHVAMPRVHGG
jgi:PPOX class probable F420-dependent enzyme